MKIIKRHIQDQIESRLFTNNIIIIYGPRQAGKTTLVKEIVKKHDDSIYLNCELPEIRSLLSSFDIGTIYNYIKNYKIVVFDEAHSIARIGELLKILFDTYKDIQFIATGSSSFELSQQIGEPLVGRSWEFMVLPFSLREITENDFQLQDEVNNYMLYGGYPEVYHLSPVDKKEKLISIAYQYASKDILAFDGIKKSDIIVDLLKYIAFQIGNDCSYNGIADKLQVSSATVKKYIDLLEKTFVIFRLKAYSKNLKNEINRKFKIYFYDIGIRNGIINQFNQIDSVSRTDVGAMFENLCIVERMKKNILDKNKSPIYFWRSDREGEVDYIEEKDGMLYAFEFKFNQEKRDLSLVKLPKGFRENYANNEFKVVDKTGLVEFI